MTKLHSQVTFLNRELIQKVAYGNRENMASKLHCTEAHADSRPCCSPLQNADFLKIQPVYSIIHESVQFCLQALIVDINMIKENTKINL